MNPLFFGMYIMSLQSMAAFGALKFAYDPRMHWLMSLRYPANVPLTKKRAP